MQQNSEQAPPASAQMHIYLVCWKSLTALGTDSAHLRLLGPQQSQPCPHPQSWSPCRIRAVTSWTGLPLAPPHLTRPPSAHRAAPGPTLDVLHAEGIPSPVPNRLPRCPGRAHPCSWGPLPAQNLPSPQPSHPLHTQMHPPGPPLKAPTRCPAPCRLCPLASSIPRTVLQAYVGTVFPPHGPSSRTHPRQGWAPHPSQPWPRPLEGAEPLGASFYRLPH